MIVYRAVQICNCILLWFSNIFNIRKQKVIPRRDDLLRQMVSSTKTTKSELVPNRGWVRICLLFAILYNVAGHPEADTSALSTFNDKNQVAAYAVNGFAWAVSNKVVGGTSNTTLYES